MFACYACFISREKGERSAQQVHTRNNKFTPPQLMKLIGQVTLRKHSEFKNATIASHLI